MSQQQRLADIASLRLTQYLVRLPDKEENVKNLVIKNKHSDKPQVAKPAEKDSDLSNDEEENDIDIDDADEEGEDEFDDEDGEDEQMEEEDDDEEGEEDIEEGSYH